MHTICTQNWASQFSLEKKITLVWLVLSCLKSELHQPQAEFISDWSLKKNVMRGYHFTKKLVSSPIRKQLHNLTTLNRSLMKMLKSSGARTDPCGTPDNTAWGNNRGPQYRTYSVVQTPIKPAYINSRWSIIIKFLKQWHMWNWVKSNADFKINGTNLKLRINQWNDTLKLCNKPGNGIIRFNKSMLTGIKFGTELMWNMVINDKLKYFQKIMDNRENNR